MPRRMSLVLACLLCCAPVPCRAGLYYSGETIADLPSQWRGFLLDQRALRLAGIKPAAGRPASPLRAKYEEALLRLQKEAAGRPLSADESADLGALYVRLGEPAKAVASLREAQRAHPKHFRIVANLATAWQLEGDLNQAAACLRDAIRLAPGKLQRAEELQLRLVEGRRLQKNAEGLDDLFGVRFVGDGGQFEPGQLAAVERKKLPADALAQAQLLALWLPADGRLLWLLAEMANLQGDIQTAAALFDGCVGEFNLKAPLLRSHRQLVRAAADDQAARNAAGLHAGQGAASESHLASWRARSKRPLVSRLNTAELPPIDARGINYLPWAVLADTVVERDFHPNFPRYLRDLEGKTVSLTGFVQPLTEDRDLTSFMLIENPVGCWYCEMPELTGIVFVDLAAGQSFRFARSLTKITGTLQLNTTDPENFLFTLRDARAVGAD